MAAFVNPYGFVQLNPDFPVGRQPPVGQMDTSSELHSGELVCEIVALSPIFIPDVSPDAIKNILVTDQRGNAKTHAHYIKFNQVAGNICIPGTSLKGTIRSAAEALGNGCFSLFSGVYRDKLPREREYQSFDYNLPHQDFGACGDVHNLCPTCRLFGMPTTEGTDDDKLFFKGKVCFNDAFLVGEPKYMEPIMLIELSSPKPRHREFYAGSKISKKVVGRKFYYHRNDLQPVTFKSLVIEERKSGNHTRRTIDAQQIWRDYAGKPLDELRDKSDFGACGFERKRTVNPLLPGSRFEFSVTYHNLTTEELNLLIYALELEPRFDDTSEKPLNGVYHKIGYGKPAGLGTCAVIITEWHRLDPALRYGSEQPVSGVSAVAKDHLRAELNSCKQKHVETEQQKYGLRQPPAYIQELRSLLAWRNGIRDEIRYPEYGKFNGVTIKDPVTLVNLPPFPWER